MINWRGTWAIYQQEVARAWRTVFGTIVSPVLTTSLYFVVFGSAIGGQMQAVGGRVETAVERDLAFLQALLQRREIGRLRDQAARAQILQYVHPSTSSSPAGRFAPPRSWERPDFPTKARRRAKLAPQPRRSWAISRSTSSSAASWLPVSEADVR